MCQPVQKQFDRDKYFRTQQWVTEDARQNRDWFETPCEVDRAVADDKEVLAVLRAEQRAEFLHDQIEAYATAYPSTRGEVQWLSALHHAPERRTECITIEAYSREEHLRAHFEILSDRLGPLAPLEAPPTSSFATLLEPPND